MPWESTSLTLLGRVKNGDERAWAALDEIYRPFLRRQLWACLHNSHDVDELTQEVFVVLHRRVGEFERQRDGSFRTFLRVVAHRVMLDRQKKQKRWRQLINSSASVDGQEVARSWGDPKSELSQRWEAEHNDYWAERILAAAQRECDERDFKIYVEACLKKRNRQEVAMELGVGVATVYRAINSVNACVSRTMDEWSEVIEFGPNPG